LACQHDGSKSFRDEQGRQTPYFRVAFAPDHRPVGDHLPNPKGRSITLFAKNIMKIITPLFCALLATSLAADAADDVPPENMIAYAAWARETKDLNLRIKRLEDFLKHYIPLEEGVKITTEYEDGSSIYAVTGSAWVLARAYVEAGQKDKALKVIDWLQKNDSKSDLVPKKTKSEQAAPSNGDKPSN
jgi:hypothetical protein